MTSGRRPWSKLQKQLYLVVDPALDFQIQCRIVRLTSQRGSTDLPRYWITLSGETIWDYPGDFALADGTTRRADRSFVRGGLANILRAADRRIGRRQWPALKRKTHNKGALRVLAAREAAHVRAMD